MKIIQSSYETICEVQCTCCREDHILKVDRNKSFSKWDEETYSLEFIGKKNNSIFEKLRKIKSAKQWLKEKDSELGYGIILTYDQLNDFSSLLFEDAKINGMLYEKDLEYIKNFDKFRLTEYPTNIKSSKDIDFVAYKSKSNFVFSFVGDIDPEQKNIFIPGSGITLGWNFENNITKKELNKWCSKYFWYKDWLSPFDQFNCEFDKEDLIEFLANIFYFIDNVKEIKDGHSLRINKWKK